MTQQSRGETMHADHSKREQESPASATWEPEEARRSVRAIESTLALDAWGPLYGAFRIGVDDTTAPDYDGGPCTGFVYMRQWDSLADAVEASLVEVAGCVAEHGDREMLQQLLDRWTAQARELDERINALAAKLGRS